MRLALFYAELKKRNKVKHPSCTRCVLSAIKVCKGDGENGYCSNMTVHATPFLAGDGETEVGYTRGKMP